MHKSLKTLLAATLAFGLSGPVFAAEPTAETVVATINGDQITLGHMIAMVDQLPQEYLSLPDDVLFDAILDQLVKQSAMAQTIEGKLSKAALLALENERRSFLAGEALVLRSEAAVTDAALQAAYEAKYADYQGEEEMHASHILVETEEEALEIKAEIEKGSDFAEMARVHSTGPTGPSGGDLGYFTKGMMVKPFEDAVLALEVGGVSAPVQSQFGWHLILLHDKRIPSAPALDSVREELAGEIQQAAISAALEEVTGAAEVTMPETTVDPALLRNQELLQD